MHSPWGGMLLLVWAAAVAALAPVGGSFTALPSLAGVGVRTALAALLACTYLIGVLAFLAAEVRGARLRRHEVRPGR
jgi:hypothetical protein